MALKECVATNNENLMSAVVVGRLLFEVAGCDHKDFNLAGAGRGAV